MLGELTVGHMYIRTPKILLPIMPGWGFWAPITPFPMALPVRAYLQGENWNPQLRAPLTEPGKDSRRRISIGVNGGNCEGRRDFRVLRGARGPFRNSARGDVHGGPSRTNGYRHSIANEQGLRNRAWIDENRRKVDQLSGGGSRMYIC